MPVLGKDWMATDGHSRAEQAGLLVECGGPYEPLTERELIAALRAVEAVRNNWIAAIDEHGEVVVLGTYSAIANKKDKKTERLKVA